MPMDQSRERYPASVTEIFAAQDAGRASLANGQPCPYSSSSSKQRFLRGQWAQGRATARVEFRDHLGMYDHDGTGK